MCYERRRAEACVDYSAHHALVKKPFLALPRAFRTGRVREGGQARQGDAQQLQVPAGRSCEAHAWSPALFCGCLLPRPGKQDSIKFCLGPADLGRIGVVGECEGACVLQVVSLQSGVICEYARDDLLFVDGSRLNDWQGQDAAPSAVNSMFRTGDIVSCVAAGVGTKCAMGPFGDTTRNCKTECRFTRKTKTGRPTCGQMPLLKSEISGHRGTRPETLHAV